MEDLVRLGMVGESKESNHAVEGGTLAPLHIYIHHSRGASPRWPYMGARTAWLFADGSARRCKPAFSFRPPYVSIG